MSSVSLFGAAWGIFALIGFFLLYSYKGYAAFYGTFRFPLCPEML
jgi:hypothetical protein